MKSLFGLICGVFLFSQPKVWGSSESLLKCTQRTQSPLPVVYEVTREGERYLITKKVDDQVIATHYLFGGGDSSAINGYGGTFLFLNDIGRSGFAMIYFHRNLQEDENENVKALIDINLFPENLRKLNTQGPQIDFRCEVPVAEIIDCEKTRPFLTDLTKELTYRGRAVSAFPENYSSIPKEENADIIKVFKITRHPSCSAYERRIEVFYTGGDWMAHGLTYFITDAPNKAHGVPDEKAAVYFLSELSTEDHEMGEIPPKINPHDDKALRVFITQTFLDESAKVKPEYRPIKTTR